MLILFDTKIIITKSINNINFDIDSNLDLETTFKQLNKKIRRLTHIHKKFIQWVFFKPEAYSKKKSITQNKRLGQEVIN